MNVGVRLARDNQVSPADLQGQLHRLRQPCLDGGAGREPVDDHLDVVPHLAVQPQRIGQADQGPVNPGPHKALLQEVDEQVAVLALLAADHGSQDEEMPARRQRGDPRDDLLPGLSGDRPAALGAVPFAHPGVEHPQVIVDLGNRPHGRAGIHTGRLLRDGNRGAQAGNQVHVRLRHLAEELAGEAGKALYVPPLPFRVKGIEGQRAFAGATYAGEADQPVPRQGQLHVPQVVLPRPLNDNIGSGHVNPAWHVQRSNGKNIYYRAQAYSETRARRD